MHIDAGQSFKNDHHEFRIRSSTSEVEVPVKNKKPNQLMIVGSSMDDEAAQHGQNEGMIDPAISENIMKSCKSNQKNITSTRLEIEEDNQENAVIK